MKVLDQFSFHHTLEETPGTALVIFTTPDCGSCRLMRNAMLVYGRTHPDVGMFEVDARQDMALTREFEVFHLPALFLYLDGRYHGEIQCETLPDKLATAVAETRARPSAEAP